MASCASLFVYILTYYVLCIDSLFDNVCISVTIAYSLNNCVVIGSTSMCNQ